MTRPACGVQDVPLPELFRQAQELAEQAAAMPGKEAETRARQAETLHTLARCDQLVDSHAFFSSNEEADDIATGHLQYLRIPSLMADLQVQTSVQGPEARLAQLSQASRNYIRFLHRNDQYGLLSKSASAAFSRVESGERSDPTTARDAKVAQFKRQKELQLDLKALRDRRAFFLPEGDGEELSARPAVDEESEREFWLAQLELDSIHAVSQLTKLRQELSMLRQIAEMSESERRAAAARPSPVSAPAMPDALRELVAAHDTLRSGREAARQGVFRPSHNLPTRSLAEQAEIEMAQAREAEQSSQEAEQRRQEAKEDEDREEEASDEAVIKARALDDWKDEHPRGYGNSKLRPTA